MFIQEVETMNQPCKGIQPGPFSNDPIVRIRDLNIFAGQQHILKNINLEIPRNKITVMLGPSGCGKTTLLKCMNKLTDLQKELKVSGNIYIEGDEILNERKNVPAIRQKMGLLSQRPYPLPLSIYGLPG